MLNPILEVQSHAFWIQRNRPFHQEGRTVRNEQILLSVKIKHFCRSVAFALLLIFASYVIKDNILAHVQREAEAVTTFKLLDDKQFPLITLCWGERYFLEKMALQCGYVKPIFQNTLNFMDILQSCLAANMSTETIMNLEGETLIWALATDSVWDVWVKIKPFNGSSYFKTSVRGQWSRLIHQKLGPCNTFEVDKSAPVNEIIFYPNHGELTSHFP